MANKEKAAPNAQFRHHTSFKPNGEILYDYPVQITGQADLDNYGIRWSDCCTLNYGGSEPMTVCFLRTDNLEFAKYQWAYINNLHTHNFRSRRCMVPGIRKPWVRCPATESCENCPHRADRKPPVVSLDGLAEIGYEPETSASAEDSAIARVEYMEICNLLNAEDERLIRVLEAKVLYGDPVKAIAKRFGVTESRIYQMLDRIKEIGQAYKNRKR